MPVVGHPVCTAVFVVDAELPVVSVPRADEMALEAESSSEVLDVLTTGQMFWAMLPMAARMDCQRWGSKQKVSGRGKKKKRTVGVV